jgi:uncharacterized membrane protein YqaE (UPF0057 family)
MPLARTADSVGGDIFRILLAVLLPPLGVFLEVGLTKHFWINVILTIIGFVPGIVHAVYIIATR